MKSAGSPVYHAVLLICLFATSLQLRAETVTLSLTDQHGRPLSGAVVTVMTGSQPARHLRTG